ncbi:AAA family ATPase [uncultured Rhodospira sp.]|uniref:AAA family ATPase n=1 Tax=uncultured Rhodospira sp. TaxID=1936189 RepID=UPI0026155132|nr:ATP-binding protein [uncultured Rhodospira sp.]
MLRRLYVHNYRCLENFELKLEDMHSVLLIGRNGSGKTTVGAALEVLQMIARGSNRVGGLIRPSDLSMGRSQVPMRFELEVDLEGAVFSYTLALEFPEGFRELRVLEEWLTVDGTDVFSREAARVTVERPGWDSSSSFGIDWHLVALPIVQLPSRNDEVRRFSEWLANALILQPIPQGMKGESETETLQPDRHVENLGEWISGVLVSAPSVYARMESYLKQVMPDFLAIKNPTVGARGRDLSVQFGEKKDFVELPFEHLSDGEKCFLVFALAMAANEEYGPLLCFWDEPDNFLAPSEVSPSIMMLRKSFERSGGQLVVTSHNPEAIRRFSDENTLVLYRNSHQEPTQARSVADIRAAGDVHGDLVGALLRGDVA